MEPSKGMQFRHARVLDPTSMDQAVKVHQLYQVTKIAYGCVYYRAVIDYGTRTTLGSPERCLIESFPKICLAIQQQRRRYDTDSDN